MSWHTVSKCAGPGRRFTAPEGGSRFGGLCARPFEAGEICIKVTIRAKGPNSGRTNTVAARIKARGPVTDCPLFWPAFLALSTAMADDIYRTISTTHG